MFIRGSQMQLLPGTIDAVMGVAQELAKTTGGLAGLVDYYLVRISDTEVVTIGIWESAAAEQAADAQLRSSLMQTLGQFLAGRPQTWAGEARSFAR